MIRGASAVLLALACAGCAGVQAQDDSDPAVQARVRSQLQGRPDLELRYVLIEVHDGMATLSGMVPTIEQQRQIERLVKRTPGVQDVVDNLVVQD